MLTFKYYILDLSPCKILVYFDDSFSSVKPNT